jgi:aminopeptidase N
VGVAAEPARSPSVALVFAALLSATAAAAPSPDARVVLSPARYELDLDVDLPAEVLRGTAGIVLTNPSELPVSEASLLLYRLLQVRDVRDDEGHDLPFTQHVVAFEDFGKLQVNQVLVRLPRPLAPAAATALRIRYEGHLLGYSETGMLYVKDRIDPDFTIVRPDAFAYPEPGYPSQVLRRSAVRWSFTYSARVTVAKGFVVANGGRLDGTDEAGDRATFRYTSLKPSWRMDFAIAKYGELAAGPVRVLYLPGDAAGATAVAEAAGKALELFERWFGPRPQSTPLTVIEIPDGWGSQTDVTTIIQTAAAFRDPKQHRQLFHELSHLWNPPDTDLPSPRWNEGLASFLEHLAGQELTGEPAVDARADRLVARLREQLPSHPEWRQVPLVDYGRKGLTDLSYSVGGLFFDLLYRLAGAEAFHRIIGRYVAEFGARGGTTQDLIDVIRRTTPVDVSSLVSDWIETTAWTDRVEHSAGIEELAAGYRARARKP